METAFLTIVNFLMEISIKYPLITTILAGLYAAGLIFKAVQTFAHSVVEATSGKGDDAALEKVEGSKIYGYVKLFFDFCLRIKLK